MRAGTKLYNLAAWKQTRELKLQAQPYCEDPNGRHPEELVMATDVHHLEGVGTGEGDLDLDNLQALCHACHSAITMRSVWGRGGSISR